MGYIARFWFVQPIILIICVLLQYYGNGPIILLADILVILCVITAITLSAYFLYKRKISILVSLIAVNLAVYYVSDELRISLLQSPVGRKTLTVLCSRSLQESLDKGSYKWGYETVPRALRINDTLVVSVTSAFAENVYQYAGYDQNDSRIIINDTIYNVVLCVDSNDSLVESGFGKDWSIEEAAYPWTIRKTYKGVLPPDTITFYVMQNKDRDFNNFNWEITDSIILYRKLEQ